MLKTIRRLYRAGKGMFFARPDSNTTVAYLLEQQAASKNGGNTFLRFEDQSFSYREANALVNRHASAYSALGFGKGDVVALMMDNRPEFLWHFFAAGKLGAVAALINTHNSGEPLAHTLRICSPKAIVVGGEHVEAFQAIADRLQLPQHLFVDVEAGQQAPEGAGLTSWSAQLEGKSEENPAQTGQNRLSDLAAYIYTSGTTGLPKAALVRHLRLYALGQALGGVGWGLDESDVIYNCLPLYHTNGIGVCTGSVISYGATMALARRFSASRFWDDVRQHEATGFIYIGELCRYLMNQPPQPGDRDHKVRAMVGNGLRPDIWPGFQQRFGVKRVGEFYGSTEGNVGTLNIDNAVGSVGRLMGGVLVRWDDEADDFLRGPGGFMVKCKADQPGVLIGKISKRASFDGYEDKAATNSKILRDVFQKGDAYFNTGDMLRMDRVRRLYFVDRMGDTFRWKGENVSTFEVQEQIASWSGTEEVNVYGVQIEGTEGRAGMASIVLRGDFDADAFQRHVDQNLPGYARPIFLRLQEQMETTGTLKLKKADLRKEGFDPSAIGDPLYFRHPQQKVYVPLTPEVYADIQSGQLRL
ncbi:MAG: long-chain-acyl-CoA synthetase [Myxococcales bacterium]|nr:long-chain-acyl-CoA synthetase [Myxococcales bacterium]